MALQRQAGEAFAVTGRLEPGDRIAPFVLPDAEGRPVTPIANRLSGRPLLLIFECGPAVAPPAYDDELAALCDHGDVLRARDVTILAITQRQPADNGDLARAKALPFPLLSDPEAKVYAACGLDPAAQRHSTATLVLDQNLRVIALLDGGGATRWPQIAAALDMLDAQTPKGPLTGHPPVLVLPRVLSSTDCADLIEFWHRPVPVWAGRDYTNQGFDWEKGDFKASNKGEGSVVQFVLRDAEVQRYLDAKLRRRIIPEIRKVFQTKTSRREDYRIACYDADDGGRLGPHRDNAIRATSYRRFTLSVALNSDFEGGGLRFREYHEDGYRVPTGTAIVWSCALLHEVLPVTAGRRFALATHLFGN